MRSSFLLAAALGSFSGTACGTTRAPPPPAFAARPALSARPAPSSQRAECAKAAPGPPLVPCPRLAEAPAGAAPAGGRAPAPAVAAPPAAPRTFRETVDDLLRAARGGSDPETAEYVDLLEEIARLPEADETTTIVRDREREAATTAAHGGGTALAATASFLEPGGDAEAMRRVFLDFDRSEEWTGKPGTRLVSRSGPVFVGETEATRRVLWLTFSARWRFEAREIDRGGARLFVSAMTPWEGAEHVLESRGVFLAVPERGGVRVAHATLSAVDFEVPSIARSAASSLADREIRERVDGLRAHWRAYVGARGDGGGLR